MFREMRRGRQALSPQECAAVLERGSSGVLAVSGLLETVQNVMFTMLGQKLTHGVRSEMCGKCLLKEEAQR